MNAKICNNKTHFQLFSIELHVHYNNFKRIRRLLKFFTSESTAHQITQLKMKFKRKATELM